MFQAMLKHRCEQANSLLCVGLDSQYSQISEKIINVLVKKGLASNISPVSVIHGFNRAIITATRDFVCSYKLNLAFYEGLDGLEALEQTIEFILHHISDHPIILDAKWGDTAKTNEAHAKLAFDVLGADAVIVSPYFGGEALKPFLERTDKGVIVVCRTSNPGAKELQDLITPLKLLPKEAEEFFESKWKVLEAVYLYEYVAYCASQKWNKNRNVLLVVGATYPEEMKRVRKIVGNMPILSPGIGDQGGDLKAIVKAGFDSNGLGVIPAVSRKVIFASRGEDFMEAAGREAKRLRDQINAARAQILGGKEN